MDYDRDKVDEMVLALLFLGRHDGNRAWKSFDWGATERLHAKGMLEDPKGQAKSVSLTEEGCRRREHLFRQHFGKPATDKEPQRPKLSDGGRKSNLSAADATSPFAGARDCVKTPKGQ